MVEGIHGAFSLATAQTFWLGVVGSIIALSPPWRSRRSRSGPRTRLRSRPRATAPAPLPSSKRRAGLRRHGRPSTDLRSSSHATAPVDPTGAVVRPPQVAFEPMDPRPATFPPDLAALGSADAVVRGRARPGGAARRHDAARQSRRARHPARQHARRDRRHRRPLPAHERAAVDRRARRLRRRLSAPRGPVRPVDRRDRSRCRRPAASMPTAIYHPTWSPGGRDAKVDPPGKKAEARRLTRVRRLRYYPVRIDGWADRGRSAAVLRLGQWPGRRPDQVSGAPRSDSMPSLDDPTTEWVRIRSTASSGSSVSNSRSMSLASTAPFASSVSRIQSSSPDQ